jgi:hypothetical protein
LPNKGVGNPWHQRQSTSGVVATGGKFTAGVVLTLQQFTTCFTAININLRKDVTTGVVVTIGKFATEVNDATLKLLPASLTREVHLELGISENLLNFLKKFKMTLAEL